MRSHKLHIGHFAFMRSVVQGLDTRESWDRYLRSEGEHDDLRHVNSAVAWIQDEFAAAAKRHSRPGIARLVRIDPRRIADHDPPLPSLEDFAQARGLHDFSHHEQIEQYHVEYGRVALRQSRRERLIARQLAALDWLERLVVQPPQSGDRLEAWLHPDLAAHLERAGIVTIRQLLDRINGLGMRWWGGIRAIGVRKAARIMDWLAAHEGSIGIAIGAHVKIKRSELTARELASVVAPATAVVPIEKLIVPVELDGREGLNRAARHLCRIQVNTDVEAVLAWVNVKQATRTPRQVGSERKHGDATAPMDWRRHLSNTQRAYLKEGERFLLWAIVQQRKPLSSITRVDCEAYRSFLIDPTPMERWCGPRGRERWGPLWRPFEKALSASAQRQAITILKSLFTFLVDKCYLTHNPWNDVVLQNRSEADTEGQRFTRAEWSFIDAQLDRIADTSASRRLRFALRFLSATGLPLAEAVLVRVDDLTIVCPKGGSGVVERAELEVVGKEQKTRTVLLAPDLIVDLYKYLAARGLNPDPHHPSNRGAHLLGKALDVGQRAPWSPDRILYPDPKDGIAAGRLYKILKAFFSDCADVLAKTNPEGARRFATASSRWLRRVHESPPATGGTRTEAVYQSR